MSQAAETGSVQQSPGTERRLSCLPTSLVLLLLLLLTAIGLFAAWMVDRTILGPYESRIYPNVYVLGENLGGLTVRQASRYLEDAFANHDMGDLILSDGHRSWRIPWSEAGMHLDSDTTAHRAYAAGRAQGRFGSVSLQTLLAMWIGAGERSRHHVSPAFTIEPEALREALEAIAIEMYTPPKDATLRLDGTQVKTTQGQPGRALAIEATAAKILTAVNHVGPDYPFAPTYHALPPGLPDAEETRTRVEDMLNRHIIVTAQGTYRGERFTWDWKLSRDIIASWLRIEKNEETPGFAVRLDEVAIESTAADLAGEPEADGWSCPTEKLAREIVEAFEAGGGEVVVELTPPPRVYVVQPGDRLTTIAAQFGMPPGLVAERNPGVDLDRLSVGQKLIIPPQQVLTPYETVPDKKIVISISEQRLRVYDSGELLHDWPCSTGKTDSPTYTGHFQVLSKEEMAYASEWDLQMPHFLGIYRAGGETYNGIHALPILSNGQRLWAGNLGSRASFGCIVLGIDEAETLYNWAELGVPVVIE